MIDKSLLNLLLTNQHILLVVVLFLVAFFISLLGKEFLERLKVAAEIVLIFIGICYGQIITNSIKNRELALENLKISLSVLSQKPITDEDKILRKWALEVFKTHADPKPSDEVLETLKEHPATGFVMTAEKIQEMLDNDAGYQRHLDAIERSKHLNEIMQSVKPDKVNQ